MDHEQARSWIGAQLDGELDPVRSLELEQHLEECPDCRRVRDGHAALKSALRDPSLAYRAPENLRRRWGSSARGADENDPESQAVDHGLSARPMRVGTAARWAWALAALAAAACLLAVIFLRPQPPRVVDALVAEVVSDHVRSLLANHMLDVASTDKHSVKPWFSGKLDYAPPVNDFREQGFPLEGGRIDVLEGRPVAALVYRHNQHVINLFVRPTDVGGGDKSWGMSEKGFNLVHARLRGMDYWAVSDASVPTLGEFAGLLANPPPAALP